eukprot:4760781-Pleurochrysis_carterae.AAC.1
MLSFHSALYGVGLHLVRPLMSASCIEQSSMIVMIRAIAALEALSFHRIESRAIRGAIQPFAEQFMVSKCPRATKFHFAGCLRRGWHS